MKRLPIALITLIAVTTSQAQQRRNLPIQPVNLNKVEEVYADKVAPVYADGTVGAWVELKRNSQVNVPTWVMAWDSMSTSPSTLASYTQGIYGTHPGPRRIATDNFKNYMWCNDMQLANNTGGKFARFIRFGIFNNPNGTSTASGSANLQVKFSTAPIFDLVGYGPACDRGLSGMIANYNVVTSGSKQLVLDLSSTSLGLPLPRTNSGGYQISVGRNNGGSFEQLTPPASVQPLLSNMMSAGEPQFPGTNPSKSTTWQWDDDSNLASGATNGDYYFEDFNSTPVGLEFAELYDYDYTGISLGILQSAAVFFADTNVVTIGGTVTLGDLPSGNPLPANCTFEIYNSAGTSLLSTQTVALSSTGAYTLLDPQQATGGNYLIYAKTTHWLRKSFTANSTGAISQTGRNVSLINGDVDGDNVVSIFDYILMSDNFEKDSTDQKWNYPDFTSQQRISDADLDHDAVVSIFDYIILSDHFEQSGE